MLNCCSMINLYSAILGSMFGCSNAYPKCVPTCKAAALLWRGYIDPVEALKYISIFGPYRLFTTLGVTMIAPFRTSAKEAKCFSQLVNCITKCFNFSREHANELKSNYPSLWLILVKQWLYACAFIRSDGAGFSRWCWCGYASKTFPSRVSRWIVLGMPNERKCLKRAGTKNLHKDDTGGLL